MDERFDHDSCGVGFVASVNATSSHTILQQALTALEPRQADLVRDFLIHHLPYKDLAQKYKMPIGSVGVSLARSLEKVRTRLQTMPKLSKEPSAYLR